MSRIGKQIVELPSGVELAVTGQEVSVKGPKGNLLLEVPANFQVIQDGKNISFKVEDEEDRQQKMYWGTFASLIANMVAGVKDGFEKKLEINGVGYKVKLSGQKLVFNLGFSHTIEYVLPKEVKAEVEKNLITISGVDKQIVGQVASQIRKLRPPEPYKGKGIKYIDEVIRRKAGKAAAGSEG